MKQETLNSPEYLEGCENLKPIFLESRNIAEDPELTLQVQEKLFYSLLDLQSQKEKVKDDEKKVFLYKQLIEVAKSIGDSIAWRTLGYNRFLAQLVISHPHTGALNSESSLIELQKAKEICKAEGSFVILNDLTNFLRSGDISVLNPEGKLQLVEVKTQGKDAKSSKIIGQRRALAKLNNFFRGEPKGIEINGIEHSVISIRDKAISNKMVDLEKSIADAKIYGYGFRYAETYFLIEAFDLDISPTEESRARAINTFPGTIEDWIRYDSTIVLNDTKDLASAVPFGVFPLDDEDCFKLITGRLVLKTTLHAGAMIQLYADAGMILQKAFQSEEDKRKFTEAVNRSPSGSKEVSELIKAGFLDYYLSYNGLDAKLDQSYFVDIVMNLSNPLDFVYSDRLRFDITKSLIAQNKFTLGKSHLHLMFDESSLWR